MKKTKLVQVELIRTEHKTITRYQDAGELKLAHRMLTVDNKNMLECLKMICDEVDCNFFEVLDAVNRTVRIIEESDLE